MADPAPVERVDIVGGGAAGLITALTLLERAPDLEVHIHEREPEPYTTLCGEGVRVGTLDLFSAFDSMSFAAERFAGARWTFPGPVAVVLDDPCVTLRRHEWVPAMADAFEAAGGELHLGTKVTPDKARTMAAETDLLVGADGPGSQVRRLIGGTVTTCLGLQYRVDAEYDTDRLEFVTDKRFSPEYAWVFPRGDILNVGILGANDGNDWPRLERFMDHVGVEGKVLKREAYPIGFNGSTYQRGNIVLVGDAAGLTNPLTKGGIAAIIHAARVLADAVEADGGASYGERIAAHPISDPLYQDALAVLQRWSNADFEALARFAPETISADGSQVFKKGLLAWGLASRPRMARDLWTMYKAMGLSREYSW